MKKYYRVQANIDLDAIVLPKVCPLLNIPLSINSSNKDYSYYIRIFNYSEWNI